MRHAAFLLIVLGGVMNDVYAEVVFHLVYYTETPGTRIVAFPNDRSAKYLDPKPFIEPADITDARLIETKGDIAVQIDISDAAMRKFNVIVDRNLKAQSSKQLDRHIALGVVVDGTPTRVIQGIFERLSKPQLVWRGSPTLSTEEARREAEGRVREFKRQTP